MHIPLRRGRLLDAHDVSGTVEAIVLSESLAARRFGREDPIGQRFRAGPEMGNTSRPWAVVVGVVGDVKQESLALGLSDAFYVPIGQWPWVDGSMRLVVKTQGDAAALAPAVRETIASIDKDQPIARVATMDRVVAASQARRTFALRIFEAFALAALGLAAIGLYGVLSTNVAERTREMGVRAALGASPAAVLALIVRQGLALAAVGAAIGLGAAAISSRAIGSLLFGVSRFDPLTYACVFALLAIVATLASWAPAWRGSRVDPLVALRSE
jgi:putative ABC transport system permease protein